MNKVKIKTTDKYQWSVTVTNWVTSVTRTYTVSTDDHGYGLWINGNQSMGTCDFTVAGLRYPAAKIRKYFADPVV